MTPNNNLSVLPFYLDLQKQNHRKDYAFGVVFDLISPDQKLLPFQFIRTHRADAITEVKLKSMDGSFVVDITNEMLNTGLIVHPYPSGDYDVIMYRGILPLAIATPEGHHYLEISDGIERWYSEMFTTVRSVDQYLKIEYWDDESFMIKNGRVDFSDNFKFNVYLPTQLGRPDYEFEEQVTKRDGFQFVEKQISEKSFKFNFVAPEYLCDALRIIRMVDNITLTNKGDLYEPDTFLITPKWQDGGYLAAVEAEFQCDTILKKVGKGFTPVDSGDFNIDYNNDYKTN